MKFMDLEGPRIQEGEIPRSPRFCDAGLDNNRTANAKYFQDETFELHLFLECVWVEP